MGEPPAPRRRIERYAIGRGLLSSLVAGRISYRLIMLGTTVLLLPVWGEDRYGTYAAAMASFSWLIALVFTGPEKLVLKLLPRSPRTGAAVAQALLAGLWWLPLPLAAAFGTVLITGAGAGGGLAVYLGVAAMQLSIGCTLLLVGLHRAAGRPRSDTFTFATMSAAQLVLLATAAAGHLQPVGYVGAVILVQLAHNVVLSVTLGRPSLRIRHRPRFLRRLAWTTLFLGGTDLFLYLTSAVLFGMLAVSAHADQLGRLYVVSLIWSAAVNLLMYLLRVFAPQTSLRLAGRAGPAGRSRAARLGGLVALANLLWLVAVGLAVLLTGLASTSSPGQQILVWAGLLASRAPAMVALLGASYLLENTDATAPRVVGIGAVAGLAAAIAAGLVAVPAAGGVGVIVAVAAGELAYALVIAARGGGKVPPVAGGHRANEPAALASDGARSGRP